MGSAPVDTEGRLYSEKELVVTNVKWSRQAWKVRVKKMVLDLVRSFGDP